MTDDDNSPDAKTKSSLGLSPVTYGLGESVKTGLWGLLGFGAAATLLVRYGKGKIPGVTTIAEIPGNISRFFKDKMKESAGEWGSAIAVGFSVGSVGSWFTHLPGLISGIRKVNKEEKIVAAQAEDNIRLTKATTLQAEEIAQLKERLDNIQRRNPLENPGIASSPGR